MTGILSDPELVRLNAAWEAAMVEAADTYELYITGKARRRDWLDAQRRQAEAGSEYVAKYRLLEEASRAEPNPWGA